MRSGAAAYIVVLLLSCLAASETVSLGAQADTCSRRTVLASVVTQAGEPVANVPASSFRGTFNGKPVRILSATRDLGPRRVIILLDASSSMRGEGPNAQRGKWEFARRAVLNILNGLPAQDEIALLVFTDKVELEVPFAAGQPAIAEKIATLTGGRNALPKGRTALFDTILVALKLFEPPREGDVIYLITDGGDSASRAEPRKVEEALLAAGVRVFAMGLVASGDFRATPEEIEGPSFLERVAEHTGGIYLPLKSYDLTEKEAAALSLKLLFLYSQMSQGYRLEIELPEPIDKPRNWKLELVDENGKQEKRWQVGYPKTLQPCK